MPCRHPHKVRLVPAALACVLCGVIPLDYEPHDHTPEPGAYRPAPGLAYSISSSYGGTAVATAIAWPTRIRETPDF